MLYEKYKPVAFEQVVGQPIAVQVLKNIASNYEKFVIHGIILSGQYGCGKTLCASLFAQMINGVNNNEYDDILIMDAALNSSVDNIRQLMDQIQYAPLHLKYRVVILEEAHMLSREAMDVLLITLQKPPANTIFIFTTTNLNKITKTLESRCLTIHVQPLEISDIINHLTYISIQENIVISSNAIAEIARASLGSLRQAISYLNTIYIGNMVENQIYEYLNILSMDSVADIFMQIMYGNYIKAWKIWNEIKKNNTNKTLLLHFETLFKELILFKANEINNVPAILNTDTIRESLTNNLLLQFTEILHVCAEIDASGYIHTIFIFFYMLAHVDGSFIVSNVMRNIANANTALKTHITNNSFACI